MQAFDISEIGDVLRVFQAMPVRNSWTINELTCFFNGVAFVLWEGPLWSISQKAKLEKGFILEYVWARFN